LELFRHCGIFESPLYNIIKRDYSKYHSVGITSKSKQNTSVGITLIYHSVGITPKYRSVGITPKYHSVALVFCVDFGVIPTLVFCVDFGVIPTLVFCVPKYRSVGITPKYHSVGITPKIYTNTSVGITPKSTQNTSVGILKNLHKIPVSE
jgi:hypothetical protein